MLKDNALFVVQRQNIHRLMSDLENLRTAETLPLKKILSIDELLQVQSRWGIKREEGFAMALLNKNMELIAQLGKNEIIQLWNQLQSLHPTSQKDTQNNANITETVNSADDKNPNKNPSFKEYLQAKRKKEVTISLETENKSAQSDASAAQKISVQSLTKEELSSLENIAANLNEAHDTNNTQNGFTDSDNLDNSNSAEPTSEPQRNLEKKVSGLAENFTANLIKENMAKDIKASTQEKGDNESQSLQLQLLTLSMEALPIPMLSCSTTGEELFLNSDWDFFRKQKTVLLQTSALLENAKQKMIELARQDKLDIHAPMEIENFSAYNTHSKKFSLYKIFLRPMRIPTQDEQKETGKTIGYLFYILPDNAREQEETRAASKNNSVENKKKKEAFLGRTLPDILGEKEKEVLLWAYHEAGENQSNAAMLLGIPRQTYAYKFRKYFASPQ